ncbi:DUF6049 family protein [Microcella alkalica]|uniref:DUF6049 family protein n=1 Tax=Microcella alkalica TaxID=355930 RepID=UPI00145F7CDA|nr:DUF6049 family protein [Microcella alkalica]
MSAERVRGGSAAPATRVRALLATPLLALLLGALTPLPMLAAATLGPAAPAAATEHASPASALEVSLAPQQSGLVAADGELVVTLVATNVSTEATPPGTATIALAGGAPLGSEALAAWFGGAETDARPNPIATAAIPALEPGSAASAQLRVAGDAAGLTGEWGPRALEASIVAGSDVLGSARSAIVWVPEGATPPVSTVTAVVPLAAPGFAEPFIPAADLDVLTAPGGLLVRTLDAVAGRPVAIGVDPRIIASIRLLGSGAPESATAFLDRLALVPNETFALAWADADPLATALARGVPLPPVEGAGGAIDPTVLEPVEEAPAEEGAGQGAGGDADPTPSGSATPSASPTPDPSEGPAVPTLADLAAWPHDLESIAWPGDGAVTAEALGVLAASGTATAIVGSEALQGDDGLVGTVGELRVLRADDALSRAARDAVAATSEQEWQEALARTSALLAASSAADASDVPLIALSRDRLGNSLRLLDLLGAIEALPWARGGSLAAASTASGPAVTVVDAPLAPERSAEVGRLLDAETADRAFAAVAVEPALITDERRLELLAALSLGWQEEATSAAETFLAQSAELRSSVQIVEGSTITLLADRTSLPVTVQNDLDVAVRVFVSVDPANARLRVEEPRVEAIIEPQSQTRALVPVQSLTNGDVAIVVTLLDANDAVVGSPASVQLNLQAGWETAAIVVLGAAVGGLFVVGLIRDIRRRRSRRSGESEAS